MNAADHRDGQLVDRGKHARHGERIAQVLLFGVLNRLRHPGDVGAGAERLSCAREHDGAHVATRRRVARLCRPRGQFSDQVFVERVANLGAVQRHVFDGPVAGRRQKLVAHTIDTKDTKDTKVRRVLSSLLISLFS